MKFRFEKTSAREEIIAFSNKKTEFIELIESLCYQEEYPIVGYDESKIVELNMLDVECFFTSGEKVFARVGDSEYRVKKRLYELYELLKDSFTYINQGCLANLKKVHHFDVSVGGCLLVVFKSGYRDYVSRRQLKNVKERIGMK